MSGSGAVTLVPLGRQHLARTRTWANDPVIMRLMDRSSPVSDAEHEAWFATVVPRGDCAYFAIERATEPHHVGNVWLWAIDHRHRKAELRVVVGEPSARGAGVGRTAIDLAVRYAFDELSLHRVYAFVLAHNPAARRAFEAAGFGVEGTLRDDRRVGDGFVDAWLLARLHEAG